MQTLSLIHISREVTTSRNVSGRASRSIVMEASAYLAGDGDGAGITATGIPCLLYTSRCV